MEKELEDKIDVDKKDESLEDKTKESLDFEIAADNDGGNDDEDDEDDDDWESGDIDDDDDDDDSDGDDSDEDDSDDDEEESQVLSDSDGEGTESCPICLGKFKNQDIGTPESCDHTFCLECIQEWSKNVNTCPVDRQVYHLIIVKKPGEDKVFDRITVEDRNQQAEEEEEEDETACELCGHSDREDRLLLCDGCDLGYHCECLSPPLSEIPVEEWFCPDCANREGMADVVDDNDEVRNIIAENQPLTRRLRYQRRIARTRVSERVRARIQQHRAERHGWWTSSEEEDDEDYREEESETKTRSSNTASTAMVPSTSSVSDPSISTASISSVSDPSTATTSTASTSKTPNNKTTKKCKANSKKRTTKTRRKRKTKSRKKSTTGNSKKRKTRKRKTKRKKVKKTSEVKKITSVKGRIATTLGLSKPPTGRTIPLQKKSGEKSLDEQRNEVGASSLSLLGSRNELIGFQDEDSQYVPMSTTTKKSKSYSTSKTCSKYSKSALLSHRPVKLSATVLRRKQSPTHESTRVEVSSAIQPPVGVHRGGPFDILGSIIHSQGKLHMHSKDVIIQRDGSLTSTKPIKPISLSTNVERMGRITLSMPGGAVDRDTSLKPTESDSKKENDTKPKTTSTSQFLASLMKKPDDSELAKETTKVQTKSSSKEKSEETKETNSGDKDESNKITQFHTHQSKPKKDSDTKRNAKESEDGGNLSTFAPKKYSPQNNNPASQLNQLTDDSNAVPDSSKQTMEEIISDDLDYIDDVNMSPPDSPCAELTLSDSEIEKNGHFKPDDDKINIDHDHLDLNDLPSPPDSPCAELNFSDNEGKETVSFKDPLIESPAAVGSSIAKATIDDVKDQTLDSNDKAFCDEAQKCDNQETDVSVTLDKLEKQTETAEKITNVVGATVVLTEKERKRYADERDDPYTDSETEFDSEIISAWKSDSDKSNKKSKTLDQMVNPKHTKKDASKDTQASVGKLDDKGHTLIQKSEGDGQKKEAKISHNIDSDDSMTGMEVVDEVGDNSDTYLEELDVSPVGSVCAELNDENTLEEELMNMEVPSPDGSPCAELNLSEGEITKEDQASDVGEILEEPVAQYSPVIDAREVINKIIEEKTREKEKSQFSRRRSERGSPRISIGQLLDGDVGKRSCRIYRRHHSSDESSSSSSSNDSGEEGEVKSRNGTDHKRRRHRKHKHKSSDDERRTRGSNRKTLRKHKNIEPAEYSLSVLTRMDMLEGKHSRSDRDKKSDRHDHRDRWDSDKARRDDRGSPVRSTDKHRRDKSNREFFSSHERDWERDQRTSRFERERSERDVRMERNFRSEKEERVERGYRSDRVEREQRSDRDHRLERHRGRDYRPEEEFLQDSERHSVDRDHDKGHRKRRHRSKSQSSSPYRSRSHHKDSSKDRIRRTPSKEKDHQRSNKKRKDKSSERERPAIREKSPFWDHERERGISPVDWNRSPVVSVEKSPDREVIIKRRRRVHIDDSTITDGAHTSKKKRKDKNKRDKRPRSPKSPPPPETISPILLSDCDVEKEPAPKPKKKGRKKRKGKRKKGPPAPPGMFFKELEDDAILVGEIEHVEIEIPSDESEEETVTVSKVPNTSITNNGNELYDPLEMTSPRSQSSSRPLSPRSQTSVRSKSQEKENHGNLSDDPSDYDPAHPTDDDFKLVKSPLLNSSKPSSPARVVIMSCQKDDIVASPDLSTSQNTEAMRIEISNDKAKCSEKVSPEASPVPLTIDAPEQEILPISPAVSPHICEPKSNPVTTPTKSIASPIIPSLATVTPAKRTISPIFPLTLTATPTTEAPSKSTVTPVSIAISKPSVSPNFPSTITVTTKSSISPIFPSPKLQEDRILTAPPNKSPIAIVKPNEPFITSALPLSSQQSVCLLPNPTSTANPPIGQVFPTLQSTDSPFAQPRPIPMSSTLTSIMNGSKMHVEPAPRPRSLLSLPFPPLTSNQTRPGFNQLTEINRLLNTQARLAGIRPDPKTGGVFKIPAPPVDHSETLEVVDMDIDKDSNDDVSSPSDDECELRLPQSPMPKRKGHKKRRDIGKDEMPSSAADLGKKQKKSKQNLDPRKTNSLQYVKKLHLQERVIEEVKLAIKPFYSGKKITKDQYKEILRRAVPKVCHSKAKDVNPMKIKLLVEAYVAKFQKKQKKSSDTSTTVTSGVAEEPGNKSVVTARWLKSINKFSAS